MLAVINQSQRQRDIELSHRKRVKIVDRLAFVFDVESEHIADKLSLADQITLRIETQYASSATPFHFDRIEARVTSHVEHGLTREVRRHSNFHFLPGRPRMVDRFANRALRFGKQPTTQIDAVKPRRQPLYLI